MQQYEKKCMVLFLITMGYLKCCSNGGYIAFCNRRMIQSAMFRGGTSIQNKVRYGYYICIAMIICIAFLNYLNLRAIDKKLSFSFIISDFFEATLEMRRFEKNYFFYKEQRNFEENLHYTDKAEALIRDHTEEIRTLSPDTDVNGIAEMIGQYKALLKRYHEQREHLGSVVADALEGNIRQTGKKIVEATEGIAIAERSYIQSMISISKRVIFLSVIVVVVLGLFIGRYFSRMVVRPLQEMEDSMQRIAEGRFDKLEVKSSDAEIVSLGNACSRMIREIEFRQKRFMRQSERLITLGTMVSGVAHELNNPLSNIYSSCQILQEEIHECDCAYTHEMLTQIASEIERAKTMVQSLLEFSRKTDFKRKPFSLKHIIADTIRLMHADLPTKVELVSEIPEDAWVFVDKQKIEQAFLNIIKNAVDAIPGEGRVEIRAEKNAADDTMRIQIQDNGIGIEPGKLDHIFDPFFTTKEEGKGSGLGLFITWEIIEDHRGTITVESRSGEGTVFTITLPVQEA